MIFSLSSQGKDFFIETFDKILNFLLTLAFDKCIMLLGYDKVVMLRRV